MTVKVVATIELNPDEPACVEKYFETTMPLLEQAGAKIVQRMDLGDVVVGERVAETVMIVEYPDLESLDRVFGSKEYKAIIPYRDRGFNHYNICVLSE